MTAEILIKFARKGIILSPEAYELIANSQNPLNLSSEIIVKLKSGNYSKDMVPVDVNTLKSMEGLSLKLDNGDQAIKTPSQERTALTMEKPQQGLKEAKEEKPKEPTPDIKAIEKTQQPQTTKTTEKTQQPQTTKTTETTNNKNNRNS